MVNRKRTTIEIVIFVVILIAISIYLIFRNSNNKQGEEEYNALEDKLCSVTLDLYVSHPEVIVIDKTKADSVEYVTFTTLAGLTMESKDKISRYILNPKESTQDSPKYFPETTRIKLRVNKSKKIVCDGIVDIGNSPVITLTGEDKMTIAKGSTYKEPGYKATDKEDGDLTKKVIKNGNVNTSVAGDYTILYFVEDSMYNISSKTRTITVK